jgi:DNA polymerase theta
VYQAPTSAGKTLVAELLAIRCLAQQKKCGMVVLPFVSLVLEKTLHLARVLGVGGWHVQAHYAGAPLTTVLDQKPDLSICTIEKVGD